MYRKLFVGLGAVAAYGISYHMIAYGFPAMPLYASLFASTLAVGLIVVEWSRV